MKLYLALDNIRSAHNVGAILRTAYGFELDGVVSIGITPHNKQPNDPRLPHVITKAEQRIAKTALGGEKLLGKHFTDYSEFKDWLTDSKREPIAIEMTDRSEDITDFTPKMDTVLILGNEIDGVSNDLLATAVKHLHIPISKQKESYNVASAAAICMYALHKQFAKL